MSFGLRASSLAVVVSLGAVAVALNAGGSRRSPRAPELPAPRSAAPPVLGIAPDDAPAPSGPIALDPIVIRPARHPLDAFSRTELDRVALDPPASLGSICVGRPNRGRLINGVELRSMPGLRVMVDDDNSFGTNATVRFLEDAAGRLHEEFPEAPDVLVGDLSRRRGGYLRPHRSHQLGLDADVGYFYDPPAKWYTRATAKNLDRRLTWALVKALVADGGVEYLFMDRSIQSLLRDYAKASGEPADFVDHLFESPPHKDTLIRHAWGHTTHFHVRFLDPAAEDAGRRLAKRLRRAGKI